MRVAIWAGNYGYWGKFDPRRLFKADGGQLGGGETAAINTAIELASCGPEVFVGCQIDHRIEYGNVVFFPADMFVQAVYSFGADVIVSWDDAPIFRYNLPSMVKVVAFQLNDVQLGIFDHVIDAYFHPSVWHATRFAEVFGVPEAKQHRLMTNATDPALWETVAEHGTGRGHRVVYCSSPDRGLHHLLRMWPEVRKRVGDAELHIYYDMDKWLGIVADATKKGAVLNTSERAYLIQQNLRPLFSQGVVYHGGVSKLELARALVNTKVLAYPCDPVAPTEGFSMTVLDGLAAGCNVITTDADALQELWGGKATILPLPVQDDIWVEEIVSKLDAPILTEGTAWKVPYELTWRGLGVKWRNTLSDLLMEKCDG